MSSYVADECEAEGCENIIYEDTDICISIGMTDLSDDNDVKDIEYDFCSKECAKKFMETF